MDVTLSTEALKSGLSTLILDSSISKFNPKSCITRITMSSGILQLDTEYADIKSRLKINCISDVDDLKVIYVESSVFKKLINSLNTGDVVLEISDKDSTTLVVRAGKSKFYVPQIAEYQDVKFGIDSADIEDMAKLFDNSTKFDFSAWKFISNYQLYALADSVTALKAYTNVYVGEDNAIIVGDYNNNLFTYSNKNTVFDSCMIPGSVVKLLISYPEDSSVARGDNGLWYIMCQSEKDNYSLVSEFKTLEESDTLNYQSDKILPLMVHDNKLAVTIPNLASIKDVLAQGSILVNNKNDYVINLSVENGKLRVYGNNMEYVENVDNSEINFTVGFRLQHFIDTISHLDSNEITIMPKYRKDRNGNEIVIAILIWTENLTVVLGA
jgi:hypothetical protein